MYLPYSFLRPFKVRKADRIRSPNLANLIADNQELKSDEVLNDKTLTNSVFWGIVNDIESEWKKYVWKLLLIYP